MDKSLEVRTPSWKLKYAYIFAKESIINEGYGEEIEWQESIDIDNITETQFLREAAWVILSSGMREVVIRKIFPLISKAFYDWESAKIICSHNVKCRTRALRHFNNVRKIEAIIKVVRHVYKRGFSSVLESIRNEGIQYIMQLPYMGPAT